MATNQTAHYGLNQWEASDKVLRADFNTDNEKIDGALAQLAQEAAAKASQAEVTGLKTLLPTKADREELVWVKLLEQVSREPTTSVNIDLSGINFLDYWRVRILFCCDPCGSIYARVNGDSESNYDRTSLTGGTDTNVNYVAHLPNYSSKYPVAGELVSQVPMPGQRTAFWGVQVAMVGSNYANCYIYHEESTWETLSSMQFTCSVEIPAGAQVLILGLPR